MNINEFEEKYVSVITSEFTTPRKVIGSNTFKSILWEDVPSDRKVYKMKSLNDYPTQAHIPFSEIIRTNIIFIYSPDGFDTIMIPSSLDQMFISEYNDFFNQITSF